MQNATTCIWYCYLALCADKSLYCGVTVDIKQRIECHNSGRGAKYTRTRRPVILLLARKFPNKSSAMSAEARIKRVPASQKPKFLQELAQEAWKKFECPQKGSSPLHVDDIL